MRVHARDDGEVSARITIRIKFTINIYQEINRGSATHDSNDGESCVSKINSRRKMPVVNEIEVLVNSPIYYA